jgi:REP element-mobilizing transposase RayT
VSRQLRLEYPGAIWHVTSRGNERRDIFRDDHDRRRFLTLLAKVVVERRWLLHAWVLMSNHYHLLIELPEVGLSRGIKWLNQTYAEDFNARHERVGHLFQGRFKGVLVEREGHLLELLRYIVLNPVRCGAIAFADEYPWSSYRATAGIENPPAWLEVDWTLHQFGADRAAALEAFRRFVAEAKGAAYKPWEAIVGQTYLGDEVFCDRAQTLVEAKRRSREYSKAQRTPGNARFNALVALICECYSMTIDDLKEKSRSNARKVLCLIALEDAAMTLRSVADWLEITEGAASQMRSRARTLYESKVEFRETVLRLRVALT